MKQTHTHKRAGSLASLVITTALLAACSRSAPETQLAAPVVAMTVRPANGGGAGSFPGDVHARYEMPLSFRVGGQLVSRYVNLGDEVKKGQALAQLDAKDADDGVESARAALDAADHRLLFALQQRDRDEAQFEQNLISQHQVEQTRDVYASALAGRDQAKQQWDLAKNQSRYTTLVADHDGTITSQQAEVGQVLSAGQQVFGFAWSGGRDVHLDIPESRIDGIAVGQAATVTLPAVPARMYVATVREISAAADQQSRTYQVKLSFDQPDPSLRLGMTAQVLMHSAARPGTYVRIPSTALFHDGELAAVWVIRPANSTLELRPVTIATYGEKDVLLAGGLSPGERLVMQGVHTVAADEKVTPVESLHAEAVMP